MEIAKALEDQTILTSNLQRQFQKLIFEPISHVQSLLPKVLVVLDAVDECEDEEVVPRIIHLLVMHPGLRKLSLKFFLTSRPESYILSTFQNSDVEPDTQLFVLHDIQVSDIRQDIQAFVRHELIQISEGCRGLLGGDLWPAEDEVAALVDISAELFIAAATGSSFLDRMLKILIS